jgi:hypothetical protein
MTKGNILKRKWKGATNVVSAIIMKLFNLFFYCHVARVAWQIVNIATGIPKANSIRFILEGCITSIRTKEKHLILVGVAAMFWSIWLCQNDIVFNKKPIISLLYRPPLEELIGFTFEGYYKRNM